MKKSIKQMLLTMLVALVSISASAYDFEVDGICYNILSLEDSTCEVTYRYYSGGYGGYEGDIVIPTTVKPSGYGLSFSVTSIGDYAFYACDNLTSVVIPSSVTSIGDYAFYACHNLTSVVIPSSVTSIGDDAFRYCSSLCKVILLPNSVPSGLSGSGLMSHSGSSDGDAVVYVANDNYSISGRVKLDYLSSMFEVDGVRYVPLSPSERTCMAIDCTYDEADSIIIIGKTVAYKGIEMTVKSIGKHIFRSNTHIKEAEVSAECAIPVCAFYGCSDLQAANLNNAGSIGNYAFYGCTKLEKVAMAETVKDSIGDHAFYGCTSLAEINMPSTHTVINDYVFYRCSSLKGIVLPQTLKTIGKYAFASSRLNSVAIPAATTSIGDYAFQNCDSLAKFTAEDGEGTLTLGDNGSGEGMFSDCPLGEVLIGRNLKYNTGSSCGYSPFCRNTSLKKVTLTDVPTEVFDNEFYGCTSLTDVTIGDGVKEIGDYAFSGCTSLDKFAFGENVTSIGAEAFSDCTAMTELTAEPLTPPTCRTQALDDINKWSCTLYVNATAIDAYKAADQWKEFFFIDGLTKIDVIKNDKVTPHYIYDLQGRRLTTPQRGLNIINGKKVLVK